MQVANTLNNSIRILFNPKIEAFKLFDFLIVKSDDIRYIAQIIEIYDDKFDASQNVAKLKLFYKMAENNEVMPYDNFTPNKECEIIKIKQDEIETFINQDRETFIFGTNVKNSSSLNIQYDFFKNNAVVLADKVEHACSITYNLAKNLSKKQNVVIIDSTGILEYENAKIIKAGKNFKMPLNYTTIDYIFDRCLKDASLEFQSVCGEIINEIKRFAKKQEGEFIPFNAFAKVIMEQYKATPYPELKLLLVRLKKYQMDNIFAKTKNDKENLFKAIEKNHITILDLSEIDAFWQKSFIEYIVSDIQKEIYLITRINDEHFDTNLINKIYTQKKNIKFVPNVSYNYKKLPTVMQYCKNYILLPSLYQRNDFLDANFALSNLIDDGCIIFGQNTDNFIYLAKDYELEIQEKRKNYRKIALSMSEAGDREEEEAKKAEESHINNNPNSQETISDSERLIKELSSYNSKQQEELKESEEQFEELKDSNSILDDEVDENEKNQEDDSSEIEDDESNDVLDDDSEDLDDDTDEDENDDEVDDEEESEDDLDDESEENIEETEIEDTNTKEDDFQDLNQEEDTEEEIQENNINLEDDNSKNIEESEEITKEETDEFKTIQEKEIEEDTGIPQLDDDETSENADNNEEEDDEQVDLSDEELDFFQIAEESSYENDESEEEKDEIDLNEIAEKSIDDNFDEIINSKNQEEMPTLNVDDKTKININTLEKTKNKENLPIFKDEQTNQKSSIKYAVGNTITHKKYGKGTIVKTIKYEERQLLQVEFEQAGKKLLDPTVADIKLEQ